MDVLDKKINELVAENYVYASVLHHLGIQFYHYSEATLAQACRAQGLEVQHVLRRLESVPYRKDLPVPLMNYPIDLVIHYLKHSHFIFINEKLPYMAKLIEDLDASKLGNPSLVQDLQLLFPLFVEDFIHHIHDEEDRFFEYILLLQKASLGDYQPGPLYQAMEKNAIHYFALDHHTHDDEMRGIREITNNYQLESGANLHWQVLFAELKNLEKELLKHARIEDDILFIKALKLEKLVREMLRQKTRWN